MLVCVCVVVSLSLVFSLIVASRSAHLRGAPGMERYPIELSAVVRLNPPYGVHGLTRCEPTPALNPRVEMSLYAPQGYGDSKNDPKLEICD